MKIRAAILIALLLATATAVAHEGHNTQPGRPNFVELERNGIKYRVGLVWLPPEPVVGEDVRFEAQFVELVAAPESEGVETRPITGKSVQLRIAAADQSTRSSRELERTGASGIATSTLRFDRAGGYVVTASADSERGPISATYTVAVGTGPLRATTLILDVLVLVLVVALGSVVWRRGRADTRRALLRAGGVAVVGLVALTAAHRSVGPALGRVFLPERPQVAIVWDAPPTAGESAGGIDRGAQEAPGPLPDAPATDASVLAAAEVLATVIPAPGAIAEVVVPVTARVVLHDGVRLGATVRSGDPLATLEHHYVLHDAVHLINTRWPLVTESLRTRREMHAADLLAVRLRELEQKGTVPAWAVQVAQGAAAEAKIEYSRARKLLAMHDAQIRQQNLVRRPLEAPISGTIDTISMVQGQLAYENDPLFTIVDLSNLWVELRVPERLTGDWRPSQRLTFASAGSPDIRIEGTLARVSDQVDPTSRTVAHFYRVDNPGKRLRVGMRLSPVLDNRVMGGSGDDVEPAAFEPTTGSAASAVKAPAAPVSVAGVVRPKPELIAQAAAPIWGRIEFHKRPLNLGDSVRKDDVLANVVLELSIDERYLMEARAEEILAELQLALQRRTLAEQQHQDAIARAKAAPDDALVREEVKMTEAVLRAAREEASLLEQQKTTYDGTMKRRDPRITPVVAPIAGVITEVAFRPGELNATGEFRRLFTIVDTSRVWIEAQVFEHQSPLVLTRLKRATFTPATGGPEIVLGRPVTVSATVDPRTRTVRVVFETANAGGRLKLGGSGRVTLEWN